MRFPIDGARDWSLIENFPEKGFGRFSLVHATRHLLNQKPPGELIQFRVWLGESNFLLILFLNSNFDFQRELWWLPETLKWVCLLLGMETFRNWIVIYGFGFPITDVGRTFIISTKHCICAVLNGAMVIWYQYSKWKSYIQKRYSEVIYLTKEICVRCYTGESCIGRGLTVLMMI